MLRAHACMWRQVGLAGPSGSGKTAFSERVSSFMPGISIISMDNYNDASKLVDSNFDGEATADG
jgi:uridine kinase